MNLAAARDALAECRKALSMPSEREAWWATLDTVDRRYLLHVAKLGAGLADKPWEHVTAQERGRILAAVERARGLFNDNRRSLL